MWKEEDNKLKNTFEFRDFKEAFAFMTDVAFAVDELDHHPTWTNTYNKVSFELHTHDAGNIVTDKDRELARIVNEIFEKRK
ncbi:4a-hydroxytetrahydrobiopterin dehydratase [Dyadobacter sandarakinus]|uniref:4a-hydroxytetrahydrobiopterin dehydratase n=1 Tax=Dyadobacter sandarakinus TaxID=2747268 RepID=A0ABX7I893_9BACT|nr:4a-hydroxytetrahydrobiopterin dehydratase [Dyadobacter sandarakinus]QRR01762.1 4a-hydroxytetrahydrobiopterin dehydratase [Dyadobacter sandarakinus]